MEIGPLALVIVLGVWLIGSSVAIGRVIWKLGDKLEKYVKGR